MHNKLNQLYINDDYVFFLILLHSYSKINVNKNNLLNFLYTNLCAVI